jgi:PucR family transcriptional regulator, purine catabolism regulatory protein
MLTIRQLLALPVMADGALVAGASGADREALWAAVVDIPEAYEWVRPDELLLTTFFGLKDDLDAQRRLLQGLIKKGVSGMVVATGQYVARVPDAVRALADEAGFPIIELPWEIPFEDVTRAVSEHSINDQYLLYKQSLAIHRALTRLVLEGGALQDVARELCSLIQRPVEIDDLAFAVVAEAAIPGARLDESRRSAVREGRSSPRLLEYLRRSGALSQARQTMSAQRIDVTEETRELGMTMPRILAPIVVARRVYGYVWIIAGERELEPLDFHAIEHAATVAALILFRNQTGRQAEERMEQHVLSSLLAEDTPPDSALREQLSRFHLRMEAPHAVVVIDNGGADLRSVELAARNTSRHEALPCVAGERSGRVVVVVECAKAEQLDRFCATLLESLDALDAPARLGVSALQEAPGALSREFEHALEALALLPALGEERRVARFDELGLLHWLHALPPQMLAENAFTAMLNRLAEHDRTHEGQLMLTLEVFLDCEGNGVRAAERLFIHRHTLKYRLRRIEKICGVELGDSLTKLNLRAALLLRRVRASYGAE